MTVRPFSRFEFDAPAEDVWAFISDAEQRAEAISVVDTFEVSTATGGRRGVALPIPMIKSTISVETEEVKREPPTRVKFVGKSRAFRVTGEHTITGSMAAVSWPTSSWSTAGCRASSRSSNATSMRSWTT